MKALTFHNTQFDIVDRNGEPWLRGRQIDGALGYKTDSVSRIYERNADEFTDQMTALIELPTKGGIQQVRIFSLRGAHLLAMLSRTKVAKEFRRWVLDVLEGKVELHRQPRLGADLDLDFSADRWLELGPLNRHYRDPASVYITPSMLFDVGLPSPTAHVLGQLHKAGYDVEACVLEMKALRHHLEVSHQFLRMLTDRTGDVLNQGIRLRRR